MKKVRVKDLLWGRMDMDIRPRSETTRFVDRFVIDVWLVSTVLGPPNVQDLIYIATLVWNFGGYYV